MHLSVSAMLSSEENRTRQTLFGETSICASVCDTGILAAKVARDKGSRTTFYRRLAAQIRTPGQQGCAPHAAFAWFDRP